MKELEQRAAADAAAAPDDAAGDAGEGEENRLDPGWQRSFAELEDEESREGAAPTGLRPRRRLARARPDLGA